MIFRDGEESLLTRDPASTRRPVPDGITIIDCTKFFRRLGFTRPPIHHMWCVKDICGVICAIFTWLLIFYAEYVVMMIMLIPSPNMWYSIVNGAVYNLCSFLAFSAHCRCMFSDPVSVL